MPPLQDCAQRFLNSRLIHFQEREKSRVPPHIMWFQLGFQFLQSRIKRRWSLVGSKGTTSLLIKTAPLDWEEVKYILKKSVNTHFLHFYPIYGHEKRKEICSALAKFNLYQVENGKGVFCLKNHCALVWSLLRAAVSIGWDFMFLPGPSPLAEIFFLIFSGLPHWLRFFILFLRAVPLGWDFSHLMTLRIHFPLKAKFFSVIVVWTKHYQFTNPNFWCKRDTWDAQKRHIISPGSQTELQDISSSKKTLNQCIFRPQNL